MSLLLAIVLAGGTASSCAQDDTTAACLDRRPAASDWRQLATARDRERLRNWREAWTDALAKVRAGGQGAALAGDTALYQPDAATTGAWPAAGTYACRMVKLGAKADSGPDVVTYPPFSCRIDVDGDTLRFAKTTGSQRPIGRILRDDDARAIFLGTLMLGDETTALGYGQDPMRDMAGIVQRVDARRWRIVLPYPAFESTLDVIELSPV